MYTTNPHYYHHYYQLLAHVWYNVKQLKLKTITIIRGCSPKTQDYQTKQNTLKY